MSIEVKVGNERPFYIDNYADFLPQMERRGLLEEYVKQVREEYPKALAAFRNPGPTSYRAAIWVAHQNHLGIRFPEEVTTALASLLKRASTKSRWSEEEQGMFAIHALSIIAQSPSEVLEQIPELLYDRWLRFLDEGRHAEAHDIQEIYEAVAAHPNATVQIWKRLQSYVYSASAELAMASSAEARRSTELRYRLLRVSSVAARLELLKDSAIRRDREARLALLQRADDKDDKQIFLCVAEDAEAWSDRETYMLLLERGDSKAHLLLAASELIRADEEACILLAREAENKAVLELLKDSRVFDFAPVREELRARKDSEFLHFLLLKNEPAEEFSLTFAAGWALRKEHGVLLWERARPEQRGGVKREEMLGLLGGAVQRESLPLLERMSLACALPLHPLDFQELLASAESQMRERAIRLLGRLRTGEESERDGGAKRKRVQR